MKEDYQEFLDVALSAVKKAESVFVKHFGNPPGVTKKNDISQSLVSDIDIEIEHIITKALLEHFPTHSIVGEELPNQRHSGSYCWFIDPIDGTQNYIHGLPPASISVALWKDNVPLIGIVSDPIQSVLYSAVSGEGATKNGRAITVSSKRTLGESFGTIARVETLAELPEIQRVVSAAYRSRSMGGSALELSYIAEGKLDFQVSERIKIYDVAAAILILQEAGGKVSLWNGGQFTPESKQIVSSNGKVHEEILNYLKS